jgi:MOSC domain-containing protein YiiM
VKPQKIRHVTLIAQEDIDAANIDLKTIGMLPFDPIETRRNILTQGVALNSLVGKSFFVGNVRMQGIERADPCMRPGALVRKRGFPEAFAGRGGLRAQVLVNGRISIEDLITT